MSGQRYVGQLPHITQVVAAAGLAGIEPETGMLGSYYDDPAALEAVLDQRGLKLGALALVPDWAGPAETEQERQEAERVFGYSRAFPGTHLMLVQIPGQDRSNLRQRQKNTIACINAVAARAAERGIACSYHPNSPPGSVFRNLEDYRILLDGPDSRVVGFAPDTGHVAKGGIDFPRIVTRLRDTGYDGWIMIEEESVKAEADPDAATTKNGDYPRKTLLPLI